jgi:hypothetical protein
MPTPDYYIRRSSEADRVSQRHFDERHVAARGKAFARISAIAEAKHRDYQPHLKGFIIRNQLQLIEHGFAKLTDIFLQNAAWNSLTLPDQALLAWARRLGRSWRQSGLFRRAAAMMWAGIPYDAYIVSSVMTCEWSGLLPRVSQCT